MAGRCGSAAVAVRLGIPVRWRGSAPAAVRCACPGGRPRAGRRGAMAGARCWRGPTRYEPIW